MEFQAHHVGVKVVARNEEVAQPVKVEAVA